MRNVSVVEILARLRAVFQFHAEVFRRALKPIQQPVQWITGAFTLGKSWWQVKLTTHFHPAMRLRITGNVFSFLHGVHRDKFSVYYTGEETMIMS
jgi:hypothetical protein